MIERAHATALLDRVVPPALATAVCAFAAGSSVEVWVADIGRPLRWVALASFVTTSIAYAAARERRARLPLTFVAGAAILAALALESSLWSLDARATAERAASFAVLVVGVIALAYAVAARPDAVRRLLLALLAAAAVVAVLSVVVLVVVVPAAGRTRGRRAGFAVAAAAGIAAAVLLSQIPKASPAPQGVPAQPA